MKLQTDDNCKTAYNDLKFRKTENRSIVYKIDQEKIVIDSCGPKDQTWEEFIEKLPSCEFRYGVYDFSYTNEDKMNISKVLFVNWNPDEAPIKLRMIYATAKESFKSYLGLNGKEVTLCGKKEMTHGDLVKQLSK